MNYNTFFENSKAKIISLNVKAFKIFEFQFIILALKSRLKNKKDKARTF